MNMNVFTLSFECRMHCILYCVFTDRFFMQQVVFVIVICLVHPDLSYKASEPFVCVLMNIFAYSFMNILIGRHNQQYESIYE